MDFVWALVYPFRGKHWYLYLPLLSIVLIIPVFGVIIGLSYGVAIIRSLHVGDTNHPGFRMQIVDGFHILWSLILYSIVFFLVAVGLDVVFNVSPPDDETIFNLAVLGIVILMSLPFFIGALRYALTDDTRTLIQIRNNLELINENKWQVAQFVVNAILFLIAAFALYFGLLNLIYSLSDLTGKIYYHAEDNPFLLISLLVATPLWLALNVCGMSYMLGQLACRMDLSREKEKRKNDKAKPAAA